MSSFFTQTPRAKNTPKSGRSSAISGNTGFFSTGVQNENASKPLVSSKIKNQGPGNCSVCLRKFAKDEQIVGTMHRACHVKIRRRINEHTAPPLYAHQRITLQKLQETHRVFDTSDPGTGKTRPALEAWWARREQGGGCALVIAVKSNLEVVWRNEAKRWIPACRTFAAYANNREEIFKRKDLDLFIVNTDATKWLATKPPGFFHRFDTLIVDESSYFKHRTSQRSRGLNKIKKYFHYRECMTGTPNSNTICDVWNQVNILDDGKRLGQAFSAFRNSVQTPEQVGPSAKHLKWTDKEGAEAAVQGLITDITIRHDFEECVDIPEHSLNRIEFRLPAAAQAQYLAMEREAILLLEEQKDVVVGINAAALRTKLLQIASGAVYSVEGVAVLDKTRTELVMDLIEERKHSITFFNWTHQRDALVQSAEQRGLSYDVLDGTVPNRKRKDIVEAYQKGFYKTLFLHPKTGAHGLTLTRGTSTIWTSPIYEPDLLRQGGHRIRRAGQTQKTETILVEALGTIEHHVYDILFSKEKRMADFLEMLKENTQNG